MSYCKFSQFEGDIEKMICFKQVNNTKYTEK